MPFFQPVVHSNILLGCVSLRVQRPKTNNQEKRKIKKSQGKRVYLFTFKGSITVEAAIAIVIFILAVFSMIGYLMMLNQQLSHQIKINNIAVAMSKLKFHEKVLKKIGDRDEDFQEQTRQLKSEINLSGEQVSNNDEREIDIVYSFFYTIPWINKKIRITERCFIKDWTGRDIKRSQELVYITKTGSVYHVTKECSHLLLHIRKISYKALSVEKNCYGKKYSRCTMCVRKSLSAGEDIFVTEDGTKYHSSLMCSGLTRNIIIVEKSKIENMSPCSRCVEE